MAGIDKLTALKVARLTKPGKYCDGKGLYLQISKELIKSWIFRYQQNHSEHYMGLGSVHSVSLVEARDLARKARQLLLQGIDPLQNKAEELAKKMAALASNKTFSECMTEYIESHKDSWKSEKHCKQWEATLIEYACPYFGKTQVRHINTRLVLSALEPIWKKKTETATRVRERIERILSWAATMGYREGENPARWHGHLQELLPNPSKIKKVQHHPSLPYMEMASFYRCLRVEKGVAAIALQLVILTACRTGEVLFAKWEEFDLDARIWVIPPMRMKASKEHRVPLAEEAIQLLKKLKGLDEIWVFPGAKKGRPMSNMAMLNVLKRMQRTDLTVHGFRSTFRVWVAERTAYPRELAELALAHAVGSAVEEAYQRSDLFERRRALMRDWAMWCWVSPNAPALSVCTDSPPNRSITDFTPDLVEPRALESSWPNRVSHTFTPDQTADSMELREPS